MSPQGGEVEFSFVFVSCLASVFVCLFDLPASFCSLIVSNSKMESPSPELDQSLQGLLSFERLDRASPDLWPEQIPGVSDFASLTVSPFSLSSTPPKWLAELEKDDMDMLQEFGSLTTSQLMEKVRGLQNLAFQLGLDEAREMTRGKFLNILEKVNSGRR